MLDYLNLLENFQQDAVLAAEAGVDGILLSNHGGMCIILKVFRYVI